MNRDGRFRYDTLHEPLRDTIRTEACQIRLALRNPASHIIEIGRSLSNVRDRLSPTEFRSWLRTEFDWSDRRASRYINAFEQFGHHPELLHRFTVGALLDLSSNAVNGEAHWDSIKTAERGTLITKAIARDIRQRHGCGAKSLPIEKTRRLRRPRTLEEADVMTVDASVVRRSLDEMAAKVDFARPVLSEPERRTLANRILEVVAVLR